MSKGNCNVNGCGCLCDVLGIIAFVILLDIIGCEWCGGFTRRLSDSIRGDGDSVEMHPSDFT